MQLLFVFCKTQSTKMTKITILLCILIIAIVCDAQNSTFSEIMNQITSSVASYVTDAGTGLKTLTDSMSNATSAATSLGDEFNRTIQDTINQYNEEIATLTANATGDLGPCTVLRLDVTKTGGTLVSEAIGCAEDTLTEIQSNYEATVTAFQNFTNSLSNLTSSSASCPSDNQTDVSCVTPIWTSILNDIPISSATLTVDSAWLVGEILAIQASIPACGPISAIKTFASEAEESYTKIQECMANLTSTTS